MGAPARKKSGRRCFLVDWSAVDTLLSLLNSRADSVNELSSLCLEYRVELRVLQVIIVLRAAVPLSRAAQIQTQSSDNLFDARKFAMIRFRLAQFLQADRARRARQGGETNGSHVLNWVPLYCGQRSFLATGFIVPPATTQPFNRRFGSCWSTLSALSFSHYRSLWS